MSLGDDSGEYASDPEFQLEVRKFNKKKMQMQRFAMELFNQERQRMRVIEAMEEKEEIRQENVDRLRQKRERERIERF